MLIGIVFVSIVIVLVLSLVYINFKTFVKPKRRLLKYSPADLGIATWEDVSFFSEDGVELKAWFIAPTNTKEAIVFVHGLQTNRVDMLTQAASFVKQGYGALLFDLRCHGESGGSFVTLGKNESQDVKAAITYLSARAEVDADRIGIVAHSMGAAAALAAARQLPKLRFLVVQSVFADLSDNLSHALSVKMGRLSRAVLPLLVLVFRLLTGISLHSIKPINDVLALTDLPLFFVHGQADHFILPSNSELLFHSAKGPKEQKLIPSARHRCLLKRRYDSIDHDLKAFTKKSFSDVPDSLTQHLSPITLMEESYAARFTSI